MIKGFPILAAGLIGYLGFVVWSSHKTVPPVAVVETPVVAAEVPSPTPAPPIEAPVIRTQHLAPDGTYFLTQRVSIMTDSGIAGVAPGTKVMVVSKGPPMHVTDGTNQFDVQPAQLTNDLDVAAEISNQDQIAQANITQRGAQAERQYDAQMAASQKAFSNKQHQLSQIYAPQPMRMTTGELNQNAKPVSSIEGGGNFKGAIH